MGGLTLGDYFNIDGSLDKLKINRAYHRKVYFPDWFEENYESFYSQVFAMSRKAKPFRATDTFKIQAGYPHEVGYENKSRLLNSGIKRDKVSTKHEMKIPKMTGEMFYLLSNKEYNPISFTTPKNARYIKDIILVDDISCDRLSYIYVISRKAQIITAWAEPKYRGKYKMKLPNDCFKMKSYETK
tara:strand:- start:466 stop:1020 length:555 start_codon:yes stop_codon:yes gene_type:complete